MATKKTAKKKSPARKKSLTSPKKISPERKAPQAENIAGWFEIPVSNMERAMKFYETVFDIKLERHQMGPLDMAWFPWNAGGSGAGGSLVGYPEAYKPSTDGVLIYLSSAKGDLAHELSRIESAGGKVLLPKRLIAENYGYMALFVDSEGNRVALHSRN